MSNDMYNIIGMSDKWRNNVVDGKFNIIAHNGYLYRACDVAGSQFVVPCTDKQIQSMYEAGVLTEDVDPIVDMTWNKIPANLIRFAWKYFAAIYEKSKAEAAVLLFYNQSNKTWRILVPVQYDCSHASVKYANPNRVTIPDIEKDDDLKSQYETTCDEADDLEEEGYSILGTIHSHCDFSAFHSSVDDDDEMKFDGVHITIGHVNTDTPSFAARIVVNGTAIAKEMKEIAVMRLQGRVEIATEMLDRHHKAVVRAISLLPHNGSSISWRGGSISDQRHNIMGFGLDYADEVDKRKWLDDPCPSPAYSFDADEDDNEAEDFMIDIDDAVEIVNHETGQHCVIAYDNWMYYKKSLQENGFKLLKKVSNEV